MRFIIFIIFLSLASSCGPRQDQVSEKSLSIPELINPPQEIQQAIQEAFPGAVPTTIFADSVFKYLSDRYQITSENLLIGISTCVDDIIYTKNFHRHPEMKGPFHIGGLAGIPFTGISGLNAFSHHVPENGTMALLVGPHIGYSKEKGWGYVLRPGQHEASSCCGALVGTLSSFEKGEIKPGVVREDDYQGDKIGQLALAHSQEILNSPNHLIALTKITREEVETQIDRMLPKVDLQHERYIVAIVMVLINTDHSYLDYIQVTHFQVYDVKNKVFLEDK